MHAYNFFVREPKFKNFFCSPGDESPLIMPFTACRYLYAFQRYSRSNSKGCLHRTEDWTFFALQNYKGALPPKIIPALTLQPQSTSQGKVSWC